MRYLMIAGLILFTAGCGAPATQPALHDFGLPASSAAQPGRTLISVNAPTWLWDNRIRYRLLFSSPSQVRFYGLDRWIAPPPELFEQLLVLSGNNQDYALIVRLQDFEQQFDVSDESRVVLRFTVEAYSDNKKIKEQEFYLQQPAKSPDAEGAINGFTDLAHQAADKIQAWLAGMSK